MIAIAKCGQREPPHRTSSPLDVEFEGSWDSVRMITRNRIFGAVGVIWGGLMLLSIRIAG